jgi:hypothetical protein
VLSLDASPFLKDKNRDPKKITRGKKEKLLEGENNPVTT